MFSQRHENTSQTCSCVSFYSETETGIFVSLLEIVRCGGRREEEGREGKERREGGRQGMEGSKGMGEGKVKRRNNKGRKEKGSR